ncbi:MAG: copper amine oxidase N-terminal domain-containing protein [Peptococcaceae bacterium]|jgi:hypothetical protein|nr:copper amine oxidase N-terminal domain-containing protein [Peptococcaceae bacterium]
MITGNAEDDNVDFHSGLDSGPVFPGPALAAFGPGTITSVFTIGSTTYTVNGQSQGMDVAPYIDSNGRTMVPVRYLAESIGVPESNIGWNPLLRMVTLSMNGTTVRMVIGVPVITVGLDPQTMDTSPQIIPPGRTMLPARFVAQAFGYTVTWNASAQTVTITNVAPQPVGQIGSAPFAPTLKNLTVTVGSTTDRPRRWTRPRRSFPADARNCRRGSSPRRSGIR